MLNAHTPALRRLAALAAVALGFGGTLAAQTPAVETAPDDDRAAVEILIDVDGSHVTIGSTVANHSVDSLVATCTLNLERTSATGNRSRSAQSSGIALAGGGQTVIGRSTVNFTPGDRLSVTAELRDPTGQLLASAQVDRTM